MAVKQATENLMMERDPSNYTANFGVSDTIRNNPIPSHFVTECIRRGEVVSRAPNNSMQVTLRYEEGVDHIELRVDLESHDVFGLSSSFERDWRRASD